MPCLPSTATWPTASVGACPDSGTGPTGTGILTPRPASPSARARLGAELPSTGRPLWYRMVHLLAQQLCCWAARYCSHQSRARMRHKGRTLLNWKVTGWWSSAALFGGLTWSISKSTQDGVSAICARSELVSCMLLRPQHRRGAVPERKRWCACAPSGAACKQSSKLRSIAQNW